MTPLDYARLHIHESHREAFEEAWKGYRHPLAWRWDRLALVVGGLIFVTAVTAWLVYVIAMLADFMGLYS